MENYFDKIKKSPIFRDIRLEHLGTMFKCISARNVTYKKHDTIVDYGQKLDFIGVLLEGRIKIDKDDMSGDCDATLVKELSAPSLFCETLVLADIDLSPVRFTALTDCETLLIDSKIVKNPCASRCVFHTQLIINLLHSVSCKSLKIIEETELLLKSSLRKRILYFLNQHRNQRKIFTIPHSREEMAQCLYVNLCSLSKELRKMSNEGVLRFNRNEFEIL